MQRTIVIRLNSGNTFGMGHLSRMRLLAHALENDYSIQFAINDDAKSISILLENGFKVHVKDDALDEVLFIKQKFKDIQPDLWIFDTLGTEKEWYEIFNKKRIPVITFDDINEGMKHADLVINAIWGCKKKYPYRGNSHHLVGSDYILLPQRIHELRKSTLMSDKTLSIGVSMGGSDTHDSTGKITDFLISKYKEIDIHIFLGPLYKGNVSEAMSKDHQNLHIKRNVPDLLEEISKMDYVICGGGLSLFEFIALGKMVMACANEVHEEETIDYFTEKGVCVNLGAVHSRIDYEKIIDWLNSKDNAVKMASKAAKTIDGNGLQRCVDAIKKIVKIL